MSKCGDDESTTGNSEADWEIFDILCKDTVEPRDPSPIATTHHHHVHSDHHHHHSHHLDMITTLRSELSAANYKKERLQTEVSEVRSSLCAKESECESLRTQTARQSTLISSLQSRLQATEHRERNLQSRSDSSIATLQRDNRALDDKVKEMCNKIRRLECELSTEENHKEQARSQLQDLVRRLCICLGIDVCDSGLLTPDSVLSKAGEIVQELQRLRTKMTATCETLTTCENELLNAKNNSCIDKQRLSAQIESLQSLAQELESRSHHAERELQITKDKLAECEIHGEKLRDELRGFESRCCRLQTNLDRFQQDRNQFLRNLTSMICTPEPCETLIKEKVRDMVNENKNLQNQIHNLREQLAMESTRYREAQETNNQRSRAEESQRACLEERLEKVQTELNTMKAEHTTISEYLVRLSRALGWGPCAEPPSHGTDTTVLAESLLERAERLALHHEHHLHDIHPHPHPHLHHHHHLPKIRRERSCHDIPLKDTSTVYALQKRVRVLRDQIQRRDLHLELLRRKLALLEDNARCKTILQTERDDALTKARRSSKQAERTCHQLNEAKAQLMEVKNQLTEAADYKITALERARKIDDLQRKLADVEAEKCRLQSQLCIYKTRARSAVESSGDRQCRDEQTINNLREEINRLKSQHADIHHRLHHLQTFRQSVARLLHLRDLPERDLLHRLQTLCNAHQEFTLLSRRYESASPVGDHPCPRFDQDLIPPSSHCRPMSLSPRHRHRCSESNLTDENLDDDFDFNKKY